MKPLLHHLKHATLMLLLLSLLLGGVVPVIFTAVAQLLFPTAANGSIVLRDGKAVGSLLLGQEFTSDKYFWGRLSATTPPYNPLASGASNYSMGNALLLEKANERMARFPVENKIPLLLLTASGSGLDPHITPEAAYFQAARVAKARKISDATLRALIAAYVEHPKLGMLGVPTVNVLALNLALDALP